MKIFSCLAYLAIFFSSCANKNYCNNTKSYLVKIDSTKPYVVQGKYCINNFGLNKNLHDSVFVRFNVYDIITGQPIKEGVIRYDNNSSKIFISNGFASIKLNYGFHNLGISSLNNLSLIINKLNLKANSEVEINCYLGDSLQW
jgi:hypothetical protein